MKPSNDTLKVSIEYIKETLMEMKSDIKEIKTQYATKAELLEVKEEFNKRIDPITSTVGKVGFAVVMVALGAFVYLIATHPLSLLAK